MSRVAEVGPDFVRLKDNLQFASDATFWVAGAGAHPIFRDSGLETDERGFLRVDTPILTAAIGERSGLFSTEYFDEGNAFLAQTGQLYGEAAAAAFGLAVEALEGLEFAGELALSGELRAIRGALVGPLAIEALEYATPGLRVLMKHVLTPGTIERSVRNVYGDPSRVTPALVERYRDLALLGELGLREA